jgi:hypothetical protein
VFIILSAQLAIEYIEAPAVKTENQPSDCSLCGVDGGAMDDRLCLLSLVARQPNNYRVRPVAYHSADFRRVGVGYAIFTAIVATVAYNYFFLPR